jgi:hypothetical protein
MAGKAIPFHVRLHLGHKKNALSRKSNKNIQFFFYFKQVFNRISINFYTSFAPYMVVGIKPPSACSVYL